MQPVADEFLSRDSFTLCDLRFVVRKNVIDAPTMDVELIAEQLRGHRAAFDVPARAARSPWRLPFHVAVFLIPCFPKREIANVFLVVFVVLHPPGRLQLREVKVRELSV